MALAKFTLIKNHILAQIKSGLWQEYQRVPSENQLAEQFSVSRMTARRALSELTDAGILTRSQGRGSFVASFKSQSSLLEIRNIADEVRARDNVYTCVPISLATQAADSPTAIALGVEQGELMAHSLLIHYENQQPLQVESRFVNLATAPLYTEQDFSQITPHEYLSHVAPLTQARHTVEAISPSKQQCKWLQLSSPEPCLQVSRTTWSENTVVSYAQLISAGSRYQLGGQLTIN